MRSGRPSRSLMPLAAALRAACGYTSPQTPATPTEWASSVRIRTKLQAAAANVNTPLTFSNPRCRTVRIGAIVFSHPKHSSIRFPLSLTDPVSARARGAPLEGAATLALRVLSHRRRRPQVGTLAHEVWGVIALIRAHPNPLPTRNFAPT